MNRTIQQLITCCLVMVALLGFAQGNTGIYLMDNKGAPIDTKNSVDISGSPFFIQDWVEANVKLSNGDVYRSAYIKINQHTNDIHYLTKDQKEIAILKGLVDEVTFSHEGNKYTFVRGIPGTDANKIVELLADGQCKLLQLTEVRILENKEFNSATVTRKYQTLDNKYYLSYNKQSVLASKDVDSILALFASSGSQEKIRDFITNEKIKTKKSSDLIKLVSYCNSILGK